MHAPCMAIHLPATMYASCESSAVVLPTALIQHYVCTGIVLKLKRHMNFESISGHTGVLFCVRRCTEASFSCEH